MIRVRPIRERLLVNLLRQLAANIENPCAARRVHVGIPGITRGGGSRHRFPSFALLTLPRAPGPEQYGIDLKDDCRSGSRGHVTSSAQITDAAIALMERDQDVPLLPTLGSIILPPLFIRLRRCMRNTTASHLVGASATGRCKCGARSSPTQTSRSAAFWPLSTSRASGRTQRNPHQATTGLNPASVPVFRTRILLCPQALEY